MGVILKNNANSTITTAISASDVGLAVATGTGSIFPVLGAGDYFYATLVSSGGTYEIVKVTARVGDTMTIVRAQEDTTAQSFAAGTSFEARVTAASIRDTATDVVLTRLGSTAAGNGASLVGVQDAGNYYAATTVEGVLQELGASGGTVGINATVDNFTGNGSTVNFTLSKAPVSQNTIDVFINGVYQNKTDFSFAGTTLTFTQAPPLGSEIEVCINTNALAGTVMASNVSYNQGGTGAVNRTVQSKLRDYVSVKDFGAVGDGSNDDTAAIQAALNAASAVYFPSGTYKVTDTLVVSTLNRQYIYGDGRSSTIAYNAAANGEPLFSIGVNRDNITFERLDFVNNNNGAKNDISAFVVDGTTNTVRWLHCGFYSFDRYGVRGTNAMYYVFEYCTFVGISGTLTDTWAASCILATGFYNAITVRNCRFSNVDKALTLGSGADEGASVRIEDCTFEGGTNNAFVGIGSYIVLTKVRALKITGNYFEAVTPQAGYAAIEMDNCHAINISANTFSGDFGGVDYTDTFLYFTNGCTAVTCENNWFNEPKDYVARNFSSTQPIKFHRNYYVKNATPVTAYNAIMAYFNQPSYIELDVSYSFSWDPGNLIDGSGETSLAQTVDGLVFGDMLMVSASSSLQGILAQGFVVASNTAQIRVQNETGSTIDLSNDTWRIRVVKQIP